MSKGLAMIAALMVIMMAGDGCSDHEDELLYHYSEARDVVEGLREYQAKMVELNAMFDRKQAEIDELNRRIDAVERLFEDTKKSDRSDGSDDRTTEARHE